MRFFEIDRAVLSGLSINASVDAFRDLLFAKAHMSGLSTTNISVSSNVNAPDGGVDASILGTNATADVFTLLAPATRYQLKTGRTAAPWQKQWVHDELF